EIRILAIHPGDFNDKFECHLQTVSLDNDPRYEALSYTWGGQSPSRSIILDGHNFEVTENLYSALIHIRRPGTQRFLWVDANL
ncbi:hypothetical protein K402DRAFT_354404, partial [Aulographum hederae CBS 113979]